MSVKGSGAFPTLVQAKGFDRWSGMKGFTIVWLGQLVSVFGTGMNRFAMSTWAWQVTGSATSLTGVMFASLMASVLVSPLAGLVVDRWHRKRLLMLAELAGFVSTLAVLGLHLIGQLQVWHLYVAGVFTGVFEAFQQPAFLASVSMMLTKDEYSRAQGRMSLVFSLSDTFAPIVSGILIGFLGVTSVLTLDMFSFLFALMTLLVVHIPQPPKSDQEPDSMWENFLFGFRYILRNRSLLGLQLVFMAANIAAASFEGLLRPMVLARTHGDAALLGKVLSAVGIGGVAAGMLLSLWKGPKRRIHGVLGGILLSCLLGTLPAGMSRSLVVWSIAGFLFGFFLTFINSFNFAIWQAKVEPQVQGRVFAARRIVVMITFPVVSLLYAFLSDRYLEPWMQGGHGRLASWLGGLVGSEPGSGMAVLMLAGGLFGVLVAVVGYLSSTIRDVELLVPDHDKLAA
jgi:DHA3 family macrolide efflux protein-like MFS transporter